MRLGGPTRLWRLAEKLSLGWMDVYLLVSSEVLQTCRTKEIEDASPSRKGFATHYGAGGEPGKSAQPFRRQNFTNAGE